MTKKWERSCNDLFALLYDRYCLLTLLHRKKLRNKKKRHPTSAINEWVTLYRNLTQSNTVETDQKTGEVLQRPFLNTSRLLIHLDTFASKNIAELKKMSSHKNNKQMSYAIPKPYAIKHCRKRPKKRERCCNGLSAILHDRYCLLILSHRKKLRNKKKRHPTSAINE